MNPNQRLGPLLPFAILFGKRWFSGGIASGRARRWGLRSRAWLLGVTICGAGLGLILFSRMGWLPAAVGAMMLTGLFVNMSNGANYGLVLLINRRALGAVAGIVGAETPSLSYPEALLIVGIVVAVCSVLAFTIRFAESTADAAQMPDELAPAMAD